MVGSRDIYANDSQRQRRGWRWFWILVLLFNLGVLVWIGWQLQRGTADYFDGLYTGVCAVAIFLSLRHLVRIRRANRWVRINR